ncbi:hypothetical protein ABZP36_000621 [Zizania latifolia]
MVCTRKLLPGQVITSISAIKRGDLDQIVRVNLTQESAKLIDAAEIAIGPTPENTSPAFRILHQLMELASRECNLGDHARMLHEIQKQEMEAIYAKLVQLEKQLKQKQALEEIVRKTQSFDKLKQESEKCLQQSERFDNEKAEFEQATLSKAVEFGRKLASKHFFRHVLNENVFEDENHLYRFLDHEPMIMNQCYNIPKGIIDVEPKPIVELASRLRKLSHATFEAYVSEDGKHVDYRSIEGCEDFKRFPSCNVMEHLREWYESRKLWNNTKVR